MINPAKKERMAKSANHFWQEIRPRLEPRLKATIHPIELLQRNELVDAFDQVGIDAFTVNRGGHLQGLASRMQYTRTAENKPNFSFRYALWDHKLNDWDHNREYKRKLYAINNTEKAILYPHYHVESCIRDGIVKWSYIARTADVLQYIQKYIEDKSRVHIYEPRNPIEKRLVICAYIHEFIAENKNVTRIDK